MKDKTTSFYFWCCILQSIVIVALSFYAGNEKSEKEELQKEKEITSFELMIRQSELNKLKALVDTCNGKK